MCMCVAQIRVGVAAVILVILVGCVEVEYAGCGLKMAKFSCLAGQRSKFSTITLDEKLEIDRKGAAQRPEMGLLGYSESK